ncbi:MAG: hypothetical protein ABSB68_06530 [Acidimicrobiales bacterium]
MIPEGGASEAVLTRDPDVEELAPTVTSPAPPEGRRRGPGEIAVLVAAGLAVVYGVLLHVWLLVHLPIWGDEAIVGIMARAIDSGHFSAFYWGQHYGGLEPYLVALGLKIGGGGEPALNATPAVLAAIAAVLVAGVTQAAGKSRIVALAAGATVWVWPYAVIWQSVREGGFRFATLCCGLTAVLCCILAFQRRAGALAWLVLGLALGLGWWASPEIAYFALPCLVLLVAWWRGPRTSEVAGAVRPARGTPLLLAVFGAALGSLPWWYANAHTGFSSLRRSALPANGSVTYGTKLSVFFHYMLPMQLGVRALVSGAWLGGPVVGQTLYVLVLVLVVGAVVRAVWAFARDASRLVPVALATGVLGYAFLYAAAPGTGYWIDGRYGIYLPALIVALCGSVLAQEVSWPTAAERPPPDAAQGARRRRSRHAPLQGRISVPLALAVLGVLGALCLTVAAAHATGIPASPAFFSGWRSGDAPMQQAVDLMRAHHIEDAYGDYWTAYDLDFLSGGRPLVSPNPSLDVSRSASIAAGVAASSDPAWLFFAPGETAQASAEFLNPQPGPGPYTEQTFEQHLQQLGISYQVVHLGILDAVVPSRKVTVP